VYKNDNGKKKEGCAMRNIVHKGVACLAAKGFFRLLDDKTYIKLVYWARIGKKLDLDNPATFNEKIQWQKLYDFKPEYATLVDKYAVRDYIKQEIGEQYLVPLLGVYDEFDDIDFDSLPEKFVIKCNHDSGGIVVCRDKKSLDIAAARKKINRCLKRNYYRYSREKAYNLVKPKIVIEQYLDDGVNLVPRDYKLYCFDGEPKYIVIFKDRYNKNVAKSEAVYDTDWNKLNCSLDAHFVISNEVDEKPEKFDELLDVARKLAKGFPQVRVDFYIINNKIYFGEITLATASGLTKMIPESLDEEIGKLVNLDISNR